MSQNSGTRLRLYYANHFKRRDHEVSTVKEALDLLLEKYRLAPTLTALSVEEVWRNLMGVAIARQTEEINLRQGVLYLKITSSALRQQLFLSQDKLAETLNREVGKNAVKTIVFI